MKNPLAFTDTVYLMPLYKPREILKSQAYPQIRVYQAKTVMPEKDENIHTLHALKKYVPSFYTAATMVKVETRKILISSPFLQSG